MGIITNKGKREGGYFPGEVFRQRVDEFSRGDDFSTEADLKYIQAALKLTAHHPNNARREKQEMKIQKKHHSATGRKPAGKRGPSKHNAIQTKTKTAKTKRVTAKKRALSKKVKAIKVIKLETAPISSVKNASVSKAPKSKAGRKPWRKDLMKEMINLTVADIRRNPLFRKLKPIERREAVKNIKPLPVGSHQNYKLVSRYHPVMTGETKKGYKSIKRAVVEVDWTIKREIRRPVTVEA